MQAEEKMTNTFTDHDAIIRTVQMYVDGGKSGKSAEMKPAFHPAATIFGYIGPDLFGGPIQMLFDWNDQNGPATELQSQMKHIDVAGTVAQITQIHGFKYKLVQAAR